jgi:DNA excision repair protein ERCC-2
VLQNFDIHTAARQSSRINLQGQISLSQSGSVIAVRHLCEFAARRGSLDFRYTPSPSASEGIQGHQWLQSRLTDYQAEYTLEGDIGELRLRGRADLLNPTTDAASIIEIKTFRGNPERINPGQKYQHLAQLKVYGALLCQRDRLPAVQLRLLYLNIDSKDILEESDHYGAEELLAFARNLTDIYQNWQQQEQQHRQQRDQALNTLAFLDSGFRSGQHLLSTCVYKATHQQHRLLLQAPTGLGKTLGVIFPALKVLPVKQVDRLFFLTARTTGRQLALDSLQRLLNPQKSPIRVLELIAREKACEHPDKTCHGKACPLAHDFYERLPAARQKAVQQAWLDQRRLQAIASRHRVCPYFLGHEMAKWSDLIIGDVNHYFDQSALLYSLTEEYQWRSIVLIDEAHNLIDRARSMYSTRLEQTAFDHLAQTQRLPAPLKTALRTLQSGWQQLHEAFFTGHNTLAPEPSAALERFSDELPTIIHDPINKLASELTKALVDQPDNTHLQQALFDCLRYLRLAETYRDHSVTSVTCRTEDSDQLWQSQQLSLSIHNLIPAEFLTPRFASAFAVVLFSATLQPFDYYRDLLGLPDNTLTYETAGPFMRSQIQLRFTDINTSNNRRQHSLKPIAERLIHHWRQTPGNHLVFFSSFQYMKGVVRVIERLAADIPLRCQHSNMSEQQQQAFIRSFREKRGQLGMAVLGGSFSEGIDLPGDELISVTVVTLGYPPFDRWHQILEERIKAKFGEEYSHGYTWLYPGMRKVVQAAGRLIRTPEDQGYIELIDHRYHRREVLELLPHWWFTDSPVVNRQTLMDKDPAIKK